MIQFSDLGLSDPILRSLTTEGYTIPTPIQAKAIPPVLEGRDLLGCAQTGTGKTAAFALPILHRLTQQPADKTRRGPALPRVLVLSPTRELATQIAESFATYGRHTGLALTTIFGGVSQYHQVKALQRGIDILVATPGRLMDLMEQRHVNLSCIQVFVLDEADRMLDMGFIQPIRKIAAVLPAAANRQTLMFSATMPKEIMHLADSLLRDPVKVAVTPVSSAVPLIEQSLYMVGRHSKPALLEHLLDDESASRVVVFTKTKHGADRVSRRLEHAGITSDAIHGNKAQNNRQRALHAFRTGKVRVLVATDVAARGLDVDGITHVINYDLPMEPEAYVHRIGRTGRAGASGIAISFCDHEERGLLRDIERLTGKQVPQTPLPVDMLPATPLPIEERREARAYGSSRGGYGKPPQSGSRRPDGRTQSARADGRNNERTGPGPGGGGGGGRTPRPQQGGGHPRAPHATPHAAPHVESKPRTSHGKPGHVQVPGANKGAPKRGVRSWSKPTGGGNRGGNRSNSR